MTDAAETRRDATLIERLERERPLPRAGFRGELRRSLLSGSGEPPQRLRQLIVAYAGTGVLLLALVAVGIAGIGPLAA